MKVISAQNVGEAWDVFQMWMSDPEWVKENVRATSPRGISTLEINEPVCTVYKRPEECVLFDPARDCNPFFHLYEALWIICGMRDVARLVRYSSNMSQFSDDGTTFNGAYGYRLRHLKDQIVGVVNLLRKDPDSRRAVLQLWSPDDLFSTSKDLPCNTAVMLKIREGALNMTVLNRSNDAVWGCYGANAVQFSILLQYLAATLDVKVGTLRQVSDSLHVYTSGQPGEVWNRIAEDYKASGRKMLWSYSYESLDLFVHPIVDGHQFYVESLNLLRNPSGMVDFNQLTTEPLLRRTFVPLMYAHQLYKSGDLDEAYERLQMEIDHSRKVYQREDAWLVAGLEWIQRRIVKRMEATRETR